MTLKAQSQGHISGQSQGQPQLKGISRKVLSRGWQFFMWCYAQVQEQYPSNSFMLVAYIARLPRGYVIQANDESWGRGETIE